jgi:hypothetical protein
LDPDLEIVACLSVWAVPVLIEREDAICSLEVTIPRLFLLCVCWCVVCAGCIVCLCIAKSCFREAKGYFEQPPVKTGAAVDRAAFTREACGARLRMEIAHCVGGARVVVPITN